MEWNRNDNDEIASEINIERKQKAQFISKWYNIESPTEHTE